ncbi:hypothetical protein KSP40_PGU017299 [Platanthera guangdongensis]|uniref:Uncharacterized protein n=1 Tax=Platanthera guangdongensis TaxID=2320717 RepID=A0ABR2LDT6_9ASPA
MRLFLFENKLFHFVFNIFNNIFFLFAWIQSKVCAFFCLKIRCIILSSTFLIILCLNQL